MDFKDIYSTTNKDALVYDDPNSGIFDTMFGATKVTAPTDSLGALRNGNMELYNTFNPSKKVDTAGFIDLQSKQSTIDKNAETDLGMEGWGGIALGLGQLGLGVWSSMEGAATAKSQRRLLDQKYDNNRTEIASKAQDRRETRAVFGLA